MRAMGLMTGQREGHLAALSLGGNVGDVAAAFAQALAELNATQGVRVAAASGIWRTPPWGKTDQADFLNMAALVERLATLPIPSERIGHLVAWVQARG